MSKNRKSIFITCVATLLVAVLGFSLFYTKEEVVKGEDKNLEEQANYLSIDDVDYSYTDNIDSYLFIGTDDSPGAKEADALVLAVMNKTTQDFAFFPINRNTLATVKTNAGSAEETINKAHLYGTTEEERDKNTVEAVSKLFGGLPIKGYFELNIDDLGKVNDEIGGVTVTLEDDLTSYDKALQKGETVRLEGDQARAFWVALENVGDDTNEARMERQEQYMQKAYNMVSDQLKENPDYITDLKTNLDDIIESNVSDNELGKIANQVSEGNGLGFLNFEGETTKTGEIEEFEIDTDSIISQLSKVMNLKEAF